MKLDSLIRSLIASGIIALMVSACGAGTVAESGSGGGGGAPAVPSQVAATQGTEKTCVIVSWDEVSSAEFYVVYKAIDTPESFKVIASRVTGLTYTDTSVNSGRIFYYRVAAGSGNKWSAPSAEVKGYSLDGAPMAPETISGSVNEIGQIRITWSEVENADYYYVLRSDHKYGVYTNLTTAGTGVTDETFTDTAVEPDTRYYYKIIPVNAEGEGAASNIAQALALQKVPVWGSLVLTATDNYRNKIQVTWPAADYAATYTLYRSDSTDPIAAGLTDLTYEDRGYASIDTDYTYTVVAVSSGGTTSGATDTGRAVTGGDADPVDPPLGVTATRGNTNMITVSWRAEDETSGYSVYRSESNDPATAAKISGTDKVTATTYTDTSMSPVSDKKTYYYWVTAYNLTNQETAFSSVASGYANPDKPGVPVIAAPVINYSEGSITVSWTAPDAWTKRYTVYRSADGIDGEYNIVSENQSGTSITEYIATLEDGTVQAGVEYYYKVKAINDVGEGALSSGVSAKFILGIPGSLAVSSKYNAASVTYDLTVTWTAVPGATGYVLEHAVTTYGLSPSKWTSIPVSGGETVQTVLLKQTALRDHHFRIRAINSTANTQGEVSAIVKKRI